MITIPQTLENKALPNQHLPVQMKKPQALKVWGLIHQIFEIFKMWQINWVINTRLRTPISLSSPLIFLPLSQVGTSKHLPVQ